ncbi:TPA: family 2 glycosyl transferase [Candidatus Gastranaerophilales bacterium HUM_20]|jgi:glycosyltransferases, probably involved in cell wall biogenesis|nr:MAG: hypothetical protein BHW55_01450 [Candidatus Melainabacteria bacterium 35_41]CDE89608.1 glycosyltransferases probably involved in cell wall biogenesis [Clostridium sp. CAG:729]DAB23949.1 MAG TPA: family 2 glycosyl transferase [Candidatus Gastranaerophilales bacterium HUM_20]
MPAISVIVPVYNTQKFLEKCLESIINQTFKDIEIICINDGSTDNSMSILNDYSEKDSRIKIINQKNAGLSCARNTGINNAKGEYIGFVDSDDWIDLDFFEKLYNAAKNYDADIASAGIKRVRSYKWKYHLKIKEEEVTENTDRKFVLCDVPEKCYVWNKIYRLEKIKQFSLYFEAGIYFEDRCFTCEALSKLKRLVVVPDTYYNYWTNPNSIVKSKSTKKTQDAKYTNEKMMKILKLNNINLEHYAEKIKKIKFLGLTILKIKIFKHKKQYILFNQIRFEI